METSIQMQNLSLQYKGAEDKAIDALSLTVFKGDIFGLLGPNGAGKTSLISILTGLITPDAGTIKIMGFDLPQDIQKIRQIIGVVPQEYALYPKLTAQENLKFFGDMYGIPKDILKQRIEEGMERMQLTKVADKKVNTFSGGMKRRVNLLAGLLHQPKLLILDEPTVGVDVKSKHVILSYLSKLNKKGATIVYSSHILHEVQDFCSRVAVLDQGIIKVLGDTKEILIHEGRVKSLEEVFVENTKE